MKLKSLIIDDEPLAHKVVINYAAEAPFIDIVGQCYSATQAIHFLNETAVDLLFLDIQMPKIMGLDFLRILEKKPLVIVTTAYQEYALESYELDVCDYLLKPYRLDRFMKAVLKAFDLYKLKTGFDKPDPNFDTLNSMSRDTIIIKVDKKHIQIPTTKIEYIEGFGNYVKVWMGAKYHLTPRTLSSLAEKLPLNQFLRIHKSFIINKKAVNYLEGNRVFLKNNTELPLGKSHKKSTNKSIEQGVTGFVNWFGSAIYRHRKRYFLSTNFKVQQTQSNKLQLGLRNMHPSRWLVKFKNFDFTFAIHI